VRVEPIRIPAQRGGAVSPHGSIVAVGAVALCTLIVYPLKHVAPVVSLSVVYLPAVLVVSVTWGAWLGAVTAVISAGAFNFFHLPPVGQFTIQSSSNWVALIAFLLVAVLASSVAEVTRARARDANARTGARPTWPRSNVLALSGRAVEASGDVDVLLLDKTGTITIGNRLASEFVPMPGVPESELAEVAQLASLADETPEGRSIVVLAKQYGIREHDMASMQAEFVPFTAQTRMSGVDIDGRRLRKGAGDSIVELVKSEGGSPPPELQVQLDRIGREGGTPLAVSRDNQVLGVVYLKDTIKEGMKARFDQLRAMGIKTVMVTGDNRLTAAKIAQESGVDDFLAEATPERKLALIREQQAAREAGNMVDLDSNPTKLIEIVEVGKQLLITRGALTTFSIANDAAKYFAILPAVFVGTYAAGGEAGGSQSEGPLHVLNIMGLGTPQSAIVSAIIFNAIVIPLLIPLSLRGVRYRPIGASALLRRNLWIYGLGGILAPFIGIKLIDLIVHNLLGG
jgi:K+-transporting ATPase ATPase B chain